MNDLPYRAMIFSIELHKDQRRKYTDEPYFLHLAEVAGIVATVAPRLMADIMIATSYLHDSREDQGLTHGELSNRFGVHVAYGVTMLSDLEPGNRAERKAAARARLALAPGWLQTIKVADVISNTSSIVRHDPKFAVVYLDEVRKLLDVLTEADPRLLAMAREQIGA